MTGILLARHYGLVFLLLLVILFCGKIEAATTELPILQLGNHDTSTGHILGHSILVQEEEEEERPQEQEIEESLLLEESVLMHSTLSHGNQDDEHHTTRTFSEITPLEHATTISTHATAHDSATAAHHSGSGNHSSSEHAERHIHPAHAVLFPPFTLTLGVVVFFLLSRYVHILPYTAIMFLIGTLMGIGGVYLDGTNHIAESLHLWRDIDSEVLLLVFLPGLIFKDAHGLNVHLFRIALPQCLIFAFPMVLAGTVLTALVAFYVFPYDWSMDLCMCFGAILSATDPVAVAALLEEVGAPPRLKTHIGGEALLNDGAAIVFFFIFLYRYLFELGIEGGQDVGWAKGFELFFRMSLGGVAIGLAFGLGLVLILFLLDRRYNREENVVQVTATLAVAYTGFYVAEVVCKTSGVIATVACGITTKFLATAMVNDNNLLQDFWTLVEHLLNTVLFVLGGVVWGTVIAEGERDELWSKEDWGYLFLLYFMMLAFRLFLFVLVYPITSRIGLRTNAKETFFQVYGGLRGAVGIALAIALDNAVTKSVPKGSIYAEQTAHLFAMVGGIAFFTLVINGSTAGPLLIKMGLADSTTTRKKIVASYQAGFKQRLLDDMVNLLSQRLFRNVNFALVKFHVPYLIDLTKEQLGEVVRKQKVSTPEEDYNPPYLDRILPYLAGHGGVSDFLSSLDPSAHRQKKQREKRSKNLPQRSMQRRKSTTSISNFMQEEPLTAQEFRLLFISILKSAYQKQVHSGELTTSSFLFIALDQSLEFAADACANGQPLRDWKYASNLLKSPLQDVGRGVAGGVSTSRKRCDCSLWSISKLLGCHSYVGNGFETSRGLSFIRAHQWAQKFFRREFENADNMLCEGGKVVLAESEKQVDLAEDALAKFQPEEVEQVVGHMFCNILLNSGANYFSELVENGLLKDDEAEHLVHDIQHHLDGIASCQEVDHPGTHDNDRRSTIVGERMSIVQTYEMSKNRPLVPMDLLEEGLSNSSTGSASE